MMRKILLGFILAVAFSVFVAQNISKWTEKGIEAYLNRTQADFFAGSLDFDNIKFTSRLEVEIEKISGRWQTLDGEFPFEICGIRSNGSLLNLIFKKPLRLTFQNLRPLGSPHTGISGSIRVDPQQSEAIEIRGRIDEFYLEEAALLNPEGLEGSSGRLYGDFYIRSDNAGDQAIRLNLSSEEPGGRLKAQIFDFFIPYLPSARKEIIEEIQTKQTVGYKRADAAVSLEKEGVVQIRLKILVPDYNLNLNLNMEIRVEGNEALFELARVMGLVKISI